MTGNSKTAMIAPRETGLLSRMNAIRFWVMFVMMFGYASTMPIGPEASESLALYGYDPSWHAIQLLFFLSGILAYRSLEEGRTGLAYLRSRFMRNIPLLGVLTIITLLILFPLFGAANDSGLEFWTRITKYILLTTFCIDPAMPLEGLMDDAKYMCLVQGSIWTLRIGMIIHIATVVAHAMKVLSRRVVMLTGTLFVTLSYILLGYLAAKQDLPQLDNILTVLRLSYAFGLGMCAWSYRESLFSMGRRIWGLPLLFFVMASLNYWVFKWTPVIEVSSSLMFICLSWILLTQQHKFLNLLTDWKNMTLIMMVIGWPIIQTLLMIYPDLGRWTLPLITLPLIIILSYFIAWSLEGASEFRRHKKTDLASSA